MSKSQLKRIAIQKGEAMPVKVNVREKFEAAFILVHPTASRELLFETRKDGRYASLVTNSAYETYQAAHAESAARIAELEQKLAEVQECVAYTLNEHKQVASNPHTWLGRLRAITNTGDANEWGVWHPEDGIIYSACYVEACHDYINDALADCELTDYMKGCLIVEMKYISPKDTQ